MPSIFSADATLDEIFDTYFDDSKWDNYKEDGKKIVTYTGDRVVESGRTLRFTFYFVLNSDDTFNLDHVTSNGTELDWLQEMIILNMLNEYYLGMNKTTSTSVATRVESEVAVSDNTVWNDSENSTSDYTEEDSDDEYAYISGADKLSTKSVVRSGMAGKTMIRIILNWMRSPMAWSWIIYLRILPITVGIMMTQRAM